jgi:hypothetical protein
VVTAAAELVEMLALQEGRGIQLDLWGTTASPRAQATAEQVLPGHLEAVAAVCVPHLAVAQLAGLGKLDGVTGQVAAVVQRALRVWVQLVCQGL